MRLIPAIIAALLLLASPAEAAWRHGAGSPAITAVSVAGTFQELSGVTTSNAVLTMGMFFAVGELDAAHHVQVVDNDTSVAMLCDENNRSSDLAGNVRYVALDCMDPSITASENKSVTISVVAGAPATGTDCSIADIVAASASGPANLNAGISLTNVRGVSGTWTASPLDGLNSGNSGWINSTTPTVLGKYKGTGGIATHWITYAPLKNGGTADPQIHAIFDTGCYKPGRAAVSGGNAIPSIRNDILIENAFVQTASPVDDWYGACIGVSCSVANFPNSTPAITLTISTSSNCGDSGGSTGKLVTAASSLFTANSPGNLITDGTGLMVITPPNFGSGVNITPTTACAQVYTAFAGSTVASGTYGDFGWNHPYGAAMSQRAWWTPTGAVPNVFAIVGSPATSAPAGPGAWLSLTGAFLNYNTSQWTPTAFDTTLVTSSGNNPTGYTIGSMGDYNLFLEQTGENCAIGVIPCQDQENAFFWNGTALATIRRDEQAIYTFPVQWEDSTTGMAVTPATSTTYTANFGQSGFGGTPIKIPSVYITPWSPDLFAHDPEPFYTSYLLTGDFRDLHGQEAWMAGAMLQNDPGFAGTGFNRIPTLALQQRGYAWFDRTLANTCLLLPDVNNPVFAWTKSMCETYQEDQLTSTASGHACNATAGGLVTPPPEGLIPAFINCTSTYPTANGTSWIDNNNQAASNFQLGYWAAASYHQHDTGMLSANGLTKLNWIQRTFTGYTQDASINPTMLPQMQYMPFIDNSGGCPGVYHGDLTAIYKIAALGPYGSQIIGGGVNNATGAMRQPNQVSLTLSALSGTNVVATLSGPDPRTGVNYFNSAAFYDATGNSGWVFTSDGASARIVAGSISGNTFQLDTTASEAAAQGNDVTNQDCTHVQHASAFTQLTYSGSIPGSSNAQYAIPWPAPGDPNGDELDNYAIPFPSSSNPNDFLQLAQMADILGCEAGIGGSATCSGKTAMLAITSGTQSYFINKWLVRPR